jgi:DNA-binding GntR family transcriptional regulator
MNTTPTTMPPPAPAPDDISGSIPWVHDRVRSSILTGHLAPGAVISQVRLARELGVSRTPLREALRMLAHEGLVDAEHNRRVKVAELSLTDLDQIYASRIMLESVAVQVTVSTMTDAELALMSEQNAMMDAAAVHQDYHAWEIPHAAFHEIPIERAGSRFVDMLRQLSDHASRYRWMSTTQAPHGWEESARDHERILEACADRDPTEAVKTLALHRGRVAVSNIGSLDPSFEPRLIRQALAMVGAQSG